MDGMESESAKVSCLEDCPEVESKVKEASPGSFTLDSSVCTAAKIFYKGKPE